MRSSCIGLPCRHPEIFSSCLNGSLGEGGVAVLGMRPTGYPESGDPSPRSAVRHALPTARYPVFLDPMPHRGASSAVAVQLIVELCRAGRVPGIGNTTVCARWYSRLSNSER